MRPARRAARAAAIVSAWAALAALGGCASSRVQERFHTLLGTERAAAAVPGASPLHVDLLPVNVPAQVDRAQWIVRQPDGSLLMLEQDRWAAPLTDEIRAALVERLASRWGGIDVREVGRPAGAVWRVRVDVQRFESIPGREARLEAAWSVSSPSGTPGVATAVCRTALAEPVGPASTAALAAGHRRNVEKLGDAIGARLRGLADGRDSGC